MRLRHISLKLKRSLFKCYLFSIGSPPNQESPDLNSGECQKTQMYWLY
ncbi:MAG: hypothetical protein PUP90_20530 [Nostoc sp. S4]|nr:hypothetical protein [Nostoc sp. S4]